MEEQLKKIDVIRERLNVTYAQAKQALDTAEDDVVKAIIELEKEIANSKWTEEVQIKGSEMLDKIKDLIHRGNVTKIRVKKNNRVLLNIPVTVGAVGVILAPYMAALGVLAGMLTHCTLEIEGHHKNNVHKKTMIEEDDAQQPIA